MFHQGSMVALVTGTTGESATLTVPEHAAVITQVVQLVAGRIPVIAGTGANSTAEAIELTSHAAILYNVPGRTALDMMVSTTAHLSRIGNIVGIKEAHGTVDRIRELVAETADDFMIVTGDDATALESMLAGCHGDISVTANVVPKAMADMCRAAVAGDRATAEACNAPIEDLHQVLFSESNPIPVKWALHTMGRCGETLRLPLTPLANDYHQAVTSALVKAGALSA